MDEDDELGAAEEARDRRRDRRNDAHERELMRTGSAKVFKQILDTQEKRARADETGDDDADGEAGPGARPEHDRRPHHGRGRGHEDGRDH
jgi:hypothetical protein